MQTVTAVVPRDPDACWQLFTDVTLLTSWVPGLEQAEIITGSRAQPSEIHFVFGSLAYTLVYAYDKPRREVRWEPKLGRREGVTGFVRFEPDAEGTRASQVMRVAKPSASSEMHSASSMRSRLVSARCSDQSASAAP
jgi:hypothetical protein